MKQESDLVQASPSPMLNSNATLATCMSCSAVDALQATAQSFGEFVVLKACLAAQKAAEPSVAHALGLLIRLYALRRLFVHLASLLTERLVSLECAAVLPGTPCSQHRRSCTQQRLQYWLDVQFKPKVAAGEQMSCGAWSISLLHYRSR